MTATYAQARDDLLELVYNAWSPTGYTMLWPDKPGEKPSTAVPWARTTLQHNLGGQASLAAVGGQRRWSRRGFLFVQIFTPAGEGLSQAYPLAKIVADALEGASTFHGVWLRDVALREVGPDGDWFRVNIEAEFNYDEVK